MHKTWYSITNQASATDINIYDEIGCFGITAQNFINDIGKVRGPVNIHLSSPGGEVFDGLAIYSALKSRPDVSVFVEGIAASIGSVIAMAASPGKLGIGKHASMMIHDGHSQAVGNAADMRSLAELLDQQSDNIASIYAGRTGQPQEHWRDLMRNETWYVGEQAKAAGLADYVMDSEPMAAASWDLSKFKHVPETVVALTQTSTAPPATLSELLTATRTCPSCSAHGSATALFCSACGSRVLLAADSSGWVQDPDGRVRYDPDGDGDDDSKASTDTDHDHWSPDGKQMKQIPPKPPNMAKAAKAAKKAAKTAKKAAKTAAALAEYQLRDAFKVDTSAWDASRAWHGGSQADDPAAYYRGICAGRKAGDPRLQSSWALPYRYSPDAAPNLAGVRNALARISQTQGLTNSDAAKSLLQGILRKADPDYEPSDSINPHIIQAFLASALEGSAV